MTRGDGGSHFQNRSRMKRRRWQKEEKQNNNNKKKRNSSVTPLSSQSRPKCYKPMPACNKQKRLFPL